MNTEYAGLDDADEFAEVCVACNGDGYQYDVYGWADGFCYRCGGSGFEP